MKFVDEVSVEKDADEDIRGELHDQHVTLSLPNGARVERLFRGVTAGELRALRERAISLHGAAPRFPNLRSHVSIQVEDEAETAQVLAALRGPLRSAVQYAYEAPELALPRVTPNDEPEYVNQRYLFPSPEGVGAEYAWATEGGDGSDQVLADVEAGWDMTHDDLAGIPVAAAYGAGSNEAALMDHGSGVLGIIGARDNKSGLIGIVPNLAAVVLSSYVAPVGSNTTDPVEDAISFAVKTLAGMGDNFVLLLEVSYAAVYDANHAVWYGMPVESAPAIHDLLRVATGAGVVVVEAAGNRAQELDGFLDLAGRGIFDRTPAGHDGSDLDSGAILVAASDYGAYEGREPFPIWKRQRLNLSNWGSRVDCHAQGELLRTATSANGFTSYFGGTSGAEAIVAGVAIALQGVSKRRRGRARAPDELRALLRDPANGYAPNSAVRAAIGSMPNLEALIKVP